MQMKINISGKISELRIPENAVDIDNLFLSNMFYVFFVDKLALVFFPDMYTVKIL